MTGKNIVIGSSKCWVCGSRLPLHKIPSGCTIKCVNNLTEYGEIADGDGEKAWLCNVHCIVWHDRQRIACKETVCSQD